MSNDHTEFTDAGEVERLQSILNQTRIELKAAKDQILSHQRSFAGHIYVTCADYQILCDAAKNPETLFELRNQRDSLFKEVARTRDLPSKILEMCKTRKWSLHWTSRGAYLHLEASELIEAIRGKHGNPKEEAGDVLMVLMSITEANGIPWEEVVSQATWKCNHMMELDRYPGEESDIERSTK